MRRAVLLVAAAALAACSKDPATVELTPDRVALYELNKPIAVTAVAKDESGKPLPKAEITWSITDNKIASVSGGNVKGVAAGETLVTASSGEAKGSATVSVIPLASIKADPTLITLIGPAGTTGRATVRVLDKEGKRVMEVPAWKSQNTKIVKVDKTGTITAVAPGKSAVVASLGSKSVTIPVIVQVREVAEVAVAPARALLRKGERVALTTRITDASGVELLDITVIWDSDAADVATVDKDGKVTAMGPGTAIIRARYGDRAGEAAITVTP